MLSGTHVVTQHAGAEPFPTEIFKFMNHEFLDRFMTGASVRIGTLSDFRRTELHLLNKGDGNEGLIVSPADAGGTWRSDDPENSGFIKAMAQRGIIIEDLEFSGFKRPAVVQCQECYVFCASLEMDPAIAMDLDENYDVCVRIGNPATFNKALLNGLHDALTAPRLQGFHRRVIYKSRFVSGEEVAIDPSPWFKGNEFEIQKEYRIGTISPTPDALPKNLKVDMTGCDLEVCWRK